MPRTTQNLEAVLDAAAIVLERREDQMLTVADWDALRQAVDACGKSPHRPDAPGEGPDQPGEERQP